MGVNNFYALDLSTIYIIILLAILTYSVIGTAVLRCNNGVGDEESKRFRGNDSRSIKVWFFINTLGLLISIYGILSYTVQNRMPSNTHQFTFFAPYTNEFYREMLMNAFLYFPFGLTLSTLLSSTHLMNSGENKKDKNKSGKVIGPVSLTISIGFLISITIESWQYFAGTGLAQGTDVIMNTLGCAIGTIPWFVVRFGVVEKILALLKRLRIRS